jgi:hypothetical protein
MDSYTKAAIGLGGSAKNDLSQITNDGQINGFVVLTQTAYDALPAGKLTDGKVYMIVGA